MGNENGLTPEMKRSLQEWIESLPESEKDKFIQKAFQDLYQLHETTEGQISAVISGIARITDPSNPINQLRLIGSVITQAVAVEHIIDDIIANFYTGCPLGGDTQTTYLCFVADILTSMPLSLKFKKLFGVFEHVDKKHRLAEPHRRKDRMSEQTYRDWIGIRNMFAHGSIIHGTNKAGDLTCYLYYDGEKHDIEQNYDKFFKLQHIINKALSLYGDLHSPYLHSMPVKSGGNLDAS